MLARTLAILAAEVLLGEGSAQAAQARWVAPLGATAGFFGREGRLVGTLGMELSVVRSFTASPEKAQNLACAAAGFDRRRAGARHLRRRFFRSGAS
jgi:hypothetical protein